MKKHLHLLLILLLPLVLRGQTIYNKIYFANGRPQDTAFTPGQVRFDNTVRFKYYSTTDSSLALAVDANGMLVLRSVSSKLKFAAPLSVTNDTVSINLSAYAPLSYVNSGLATKEPVITPGIAGQYFAYNKTWQVLDRAAVGLPFVDNTSDLNKPVSTAQQAALDTKPTIGGDVTTLSYRLGTNNQKPVRLKTNDTTRVFVDSTGTKVGIGTVSPDSMLSVNGSGRFSGWLAALTGINTQLIGAFGSNALSLQTNSITRVTVNAQGRVLINSSDNGYRLNVAGGISGDTLRAGIFEILNFTDIATVTQAAALASTSYNTPGALRNFRLGGGSGDHFIFSNIGGVKYYKTFDPVEPFENTQTLFVDSLRGPDLSTSLDSNRSYHLVIARQIGPAEIAAEYYIWFNSTSTAQVVTVRPTPNISVSVVNKRVVATNNTGVNNLVYRLEAGPAWSGGFAPFLSYFTASNSTVDAIRIGAAFSANTTTGQTGIGTTSPDASAIVDIISTTQAARNAPPMTKSQRDAIASPKVGFKVTVTDGGYPSFHNGTNWTGDLISSAAATLTLAHGNNYVFTGSTTTWTLPAVSANTVSQANAITIKNRGSGSITLNSNIGSTIYSTSAVGSLTITAGSSVTLMPDGTYFNVE